MKGCGVFDEWRPDLMGTCRPDFAANVVDKDVSVTTPYGRIRGFYVHLFDGPGVAIGDRPGPNHYRKLWRTVSTFLGIPYATPPVNEGRFKVIYSAAPGISMNHTLPSVTHWNTPAQPILLIWNSSLSNNKKKNKKKKKKKKEKRDKKSFEKKQVFRICWTQTTKGSAVSHKSCVEYLPACQIKEKN